HRRSGCPTSPMCRRWPKPCPALRRWAGRGWWRPSARPKRSCARRARICAKWSATPRSRPSLSAAAAIRFRCPPPKSPPSFTISNNSGPRAPGRPPPSHKDQRSRPAHPGAAVGSFALHSADFFPRLDAAAAGRCGTPPGTRKRMVAGEAILDPAIVADGASKLFLDGAVVAFHQLSLVVKRDGVMCVVGPSGCGKTTLLRCMAGLTDLSSGRLLVHGKAVGARPPDGVAMVFQHFGLLPWKTVFDNAAFGLAMAGVP